MLLSMCAMSAELKLMVEGQNGPVHLVNDKGVIKRIENMPMHVTQGSCDDVSNALRIMRDECT